MRLLAQPKKLTSFSSPLLASATTSSDMSFDKFSHFSSKEFKVSKRVESLTKGVVFWYLLFGVFTYLSNVERCHSELYTVDFGNSKTAENKSFLESYNRAAYMYYIVCSVTSLSSPLPFLSRLSSEYTTPPQYLGISNDSWVIEFQLFL